MAAAGPGERVLWGLIILVVLGYLAGNLLNRRRSKAIGLWLQGALPVMGGRATWRWIRSMTSGAQVTVSDALRPFQQLEISYYLLTREFAPLWLIERLRGKRDTLVVRARLRQTPAEEIEVLPIEGPLRRRLDEHAGERAWQWREAPAGLGIATRAGQENSRAARAVRPLVERYAIHLERLSLRQRQPNLVLFVRLEGLERLPAADFFGVLRKCVSAAPAVKSEVEGEKARA